MLAGTIGVYFFLFLGLYFEIFLLISFFERQPEQKSAALPRYFPTVSIIVPCWNEEKTLAATMQSLFALEYPKERLSFIIVNDGSTDNTLAVARGFESHPQVKVFSKENGGKYTALNLGIESCDSELVGCLDADSSVAPDALIESVKKFVENDRTMAVVPAMRVNNPRNMLELMQAVEYTFGIFYKKMFDNLAAISVLPGPFSIYRRSVFAIVGPFRHAHNTEDMEMAFRLHQHGLLIENAHTAVVYTNAPKTVRSLVKQRTRWSQGFLQNSQDYHYMYFNPRFGNFGLLVLPFGLTMFFGALYMTAFLLYHFAQAIIIRVGDLWLARVPLHMPLFTFDWFYIDTSMLAVLAVVTLLMTLVAILIGRRIAGANFGLASLVSYFALYGFIAPIWLARAAWGAVRAQESTWR